MDSRNKNLVSAIAEFYGLITQLPYIDTDALIYPPKQQGWPDLNAAELRKRGRTEEVIALLRRLPYLKSSDNVKGKKGWMIGPDTHAISYFNGEVYDEELDKIQPTPGHCIWLANASESENGVALLLDVENGTITEYSVRSNRNVCLDAEKYQALPLEDRWMAHSTLPATEFFRVWINKYKKLEWMPFVEEGGTPESVMWFIRPVQDDDIFGDEEDYEEDEDESYEPSSEESDDDEDDDWDSEDYDSEDDPYEYDSEYESDDVDDDVPVDHDTLETKVQELSIDEVKSGKPDSARGKPDQEIRLANGGVLRTENYDLVAAVNQAYMIYMANGWPDAFDRQECRRQLFELSKRIGT